MLIGDDPSNPRFIRTVHRFGYAFRETVPRAETGRPASRGEVSFRVKWVTGRVTLDEGEHVLGRDPDVEIFLNSPGVSRRHALIKISAGRATIEDLGSKNGTFVGDRASRRLQIAWRRRHHRGRLREADGQGASDAELDRDRAAEGAS